MDSLRIFNQIILKDREITHKGFSLKDIIEKMLLY